MVEDMAAIRAALVEIVRDPSRRPNISDDFSTYLINTHWAQPEAYFDIFGGTNAVINEWRLCRRGEDYLYENPLTLDELSSRVS